MFRSFGTGLVMAGLLAGCAGQTPTPPTNAAALPPKSACPGVAEVDADRMRREREAFLATEQGQAAVRRHMERVAVVATQPDAPHQPGEDASVVIRVLTPSGGFYPNEIRAITWRDADGVWWWWRQNRDEGRPPPPPPPGVTRWSVTEWERWPPSSGRLSAGQAAAMEAALNDPCRGWDPDVWPYEVPLDYGPEMLGPVRPCAPDGGVYFGDIIEPGRPPRIIGSACINRTPTFALMQTTLMATDIEAD